MRQLSSSQYAAFLSEKRVAAVHFDAAWNVGYRQEMRRRMRDAAEAIGEQANFGEVDCDTEIALARSLPIINVPTVAYYRDGVLVAALIGANQNVKQRVERLLRGDPIGYHDGTDASGQP